MQIKVRSLFPYVVLVGVLLRLGFVLGANPNDLTFHSGGSDAPAYVLLATNLRTGAGLSYGALPSAFRPPGYPVMIAGFMSLFGGKYISAIRWVQFVIGLLTIAVSALVARRLFDARTAKASFMLGLFLPTLIFTTAQVLTECIAALLIALYFHALVIQCERADAKSACGMGVFAGLNSLFRFNAAALPIFSAWALLSMGRRRPLLLRMACVLGLPVLIAMPWFIRNEVVFHGEVLYSTHTGANAVQGVLTPQGRTQPGDSERLLKGMGWTLSELETNDSSRLSLGPEVELNKNALAVVPRLWKAERWHAIPLLGGKIADFWLSTDQLISVRSFALRERALRLAGVGAQWVILALATVGWFALRKLRPAVANFFLVYAVGYTILHLPLVMSTRLRIPLMEPLQVILAGAGLVQVCQLWPKSLPTDLPSQTEKEGHVLESIGTLNER